MTTYYGNRAIYNDIEFRNVLTENIECNVVKDSTGTDPVMVEVSITFKGIVHLMSGQNHLGVPADRAHNTGSDGDGTTGGHRLGYAFSDGDSGTTDTMAAAVRTLTRKLTAPRKEFKFYIGEHLCYDIRPAMTEDPNYKPNDKATSATGIDVNKGPTPSFTIGKLINDNSAHARMTVRFTLSACDGEEATSYSEYEGRVLHMRYWFSDDTDGSSWLKSRTWTGKVRVASQKLTPHALRYAIIPPLISGYKRKSISLSESPDGLELDFRVTDTQVHAQPPFPASDWSGYHMVSTPFVGGAVADETVYVRLMGPPGVDKIALISLALQIIDNKIHYINVENNDSVLLQHASIKDDFAENTIEAQAKFRLVGKLGEGEAIYNIPTFKLGLPLNLTGYDQRISQYDRPPGESLADLFTAKLQTPCDPAFVTNPSDNRVPAGTTYPVNATDGSSAPQPGNVAQQQSQYTDEHRASVYTDYRIDSDYFVSAGRALLAKANVGSSSQQDGPDAETPQTTTSSNVILPMFAPQAIREIRIEGERLNKWPAIPKDIDFTDVNGIVHKVLEYKILGQGSELSSDGLKTIYRIGIQIRYAMSRAPTLEDQLTIGQLPYRTATQSTNGAPSYQIAANAFVDPWTLYGGTGFQA